MAAVGSGNHLQIGANYGEASTWNPAPAIQDAVNIFAQRKAQRDAERQQMVQQMGTLDPSKIRQQDQQDYYNKFNDWQQASIAAQQKPQNSYDKMVAQGEAQQKLNALHSFIGQSKQEQVAQMQLAQDMNKNQHMFSDDAYARVMKSFNSPMSSPYYIPSSQFGNLSRYVDGNKMDDMLNTVYSSHLGGLPKKRVSIAGKDPNGQQGTFNSNQRQLAPTDVLADAAHLYTSDDDFRTHIDRMYPNIVAPNGDPQQTAMMRIRQNAIDRGDLNVANDGSLSTGQRKYLNENEDLGFKTKNNSLANHIAERQSDIANPLPFRENPNTSAPTPAQTLISNVQNQVPGSGEKLVSLASKSNNYDKGKYGDLHPSPSIDPKTGEHVFYFPRQVDAKITAANNSYKSGQLANGNDIDPSKIKDDTKFPETTYRLNPISPDYTAKMAQMAKEQNINLNQLNQIEGKKGGHGIIPQAQGTAQPVTTHVKKSASTYGL